ATPSTDGEGMLAAVTVNVWVRGPAGTPFAFQFDASAHLMGSPEYTPDTNVSPDADASAGRDEPVYGSVGTFLFTQHLVRDGPRDISGSAVYRGESGVEKVILGTVYSHAGDVFLDASS